MSNNNEKEENSTFIDTTIAVILGLYLYYDFPKEIAEMELASILFYSAIILGIYLFKKFKIYKKARILLQVMMEKK